MSLAYTPPPGWDFTSVGDLANPEKGSIRIGPFGSALKKHEYSENGVRVLGIEDVYPNQFVSDRCKYIPEAKFLELTQYEVRNGDVLVTNMGTVGRACSVPAGTERSIISSHLIKVSLNRSKADPNYLCWMLNFSPLVVAQIRAKSHGAIMAGFNTSLLKSLQIPLPPLAEQKRIAGILDAAFALRAKRRESLAQLDTLLQSTFLDMFGDPLKNGWEMVTVDDVARDEKSSIRTGPFGSQLLHSEFVDEGICVLGIDNVVTNAFKQGKPRFITPQKYEQLRRYTVRPGDVLITIMGTCGRCAVVPDDIGVAINTKHLCCITLNQDKCLPEFMHTYFLQHPIARRYLERSAKGAIMSGLNMGIIRALPIPLAPLDFQHRFAATVDSVEQLKASHRAHLAELDTLFASLQSRAFRGDL